MEIESISKNNIPTILLEIFNPPKTLRVLGNKDLLKKINNKELIPITVVGSRKFSLYGKTACEKVLKDLSNYPVCIVSGLALGIDSIAHELAIKYSMPTISVLPSGLKNIYPRMHSGLAEKILKNNGLLISELEDFDSPERYSFAQRNRIMVGLSKFVLIVECESKSGTLITANLAAENNRDVGVIPHQIFSSTGEGANQLIRNGAQLITSGKDIIKELFADELKINEKKQTDILTSLQKKILDHIDGETSKQQLFEKVNIEISELQTELTILELDGYIKEELGVIIKL